MAIHDEQAFLDSYVNLMTTVWADKGAEASLQADPTAYAIAAGLPVEDGATVVLDQSATDGLYAKEVLVSGWTADPSAPILYVPTTAIVDIAELSEGELEQVAGGKTTIVIACVVIA